MEGEPLSVSFTRMVIANWNQSSLLMWGTLVSSKKLQPKGKYVHTQVTLSYHQKKKMEKLDLKGKINSRMISKGVYWIRTFNDIYRFFLR